MRSLRAVAMRGGHEFTQSERLQADGKATWREFYLILVPYFWPQGLYNRASALGCFLALAISKGCNIAAPAFLAFATDALTQSPPDWGGSARSIIAFGMLRLGVSAFEEIQRLVYLRVKEVAYHEVACKSFQHVHSLSLHWHINKRSGVVMRAMDRGISSANTVVEMLFLRLVPTVIEMILLAAIFAGAYHAGNAAGVLSASFVLYFVVTYYLTQWRSSIRMTMHRADNEANQIAVDSLTGFETVKAFNNEKYELGRYSSAIKFYQAATRQTQASLVAMNISQAFIMRMALIGVMLVTAVDVTRGSLTIGEFVAIQSYVIQLFQPLAWLGSLYTMIQNAYTDMRNLADLMQEEPNIVDLPHAPALAISDRAAGATIEFRDVVFAYPAGATNRIEQQMNEQASADQARAAVPPWWHPRRWMSGSKKPSEAATGERAALAAADSVAAAAVDVEAPPASTVNKEPVLRGISFTIRAGTTTAVVGATGAGKSTLSKLLFRFYDVTSGAILIDGQDVRHVGQDSLRAAIGIVPQDTVLFNDTIRFNIKYGRTDATDDAMITAARSAQIAEFVSTQKDGYDTRVGERGLRLSGGEKQRVAIARMLLKDPPILILDEATASLDTLTEAQIQAAINRVRHGRTVLCIAHRLSTVRDADEIIVLDQGIIAERGSHEQLLAAQGKYAALWQQQAADIRDGGIVTASPRTTEGGDGGPASSPSPRKQGGSGIGASAAAPGHHAHGGRH